MTQGRGADHRVGREEAAEDLTVGVRIERGVDVVLQPADLLDQDLEGVDEPDHDRAARARLDRFGASRRRGAQPLE